MRCPSPPRRSRRCGPGRRCSPCRAVCRCRCRYPRTCCGHLDRAGGADARHSARGTGAATGGAAVSGPTGQVRRADRSPHVSAAVAAVTAGERTASRRQRPISAPRDHVAAGAVPATGHRTGRGDRRSVAGWPSVFPEGSPDGQPAGDGDEPVPAAAQGQPGRLVPVGRGGVRRGEAARRPDPAVDRLRGLPLVPRHGARVLRGRRDGRPDERRVRQRQGGPRGAAGRRRRLHERDPGPHRAGRLADDGLPHPRRQAVLRRHVLPAAARARPPSFRQLLTAISDTWADAARRGRGRRRSDRGSAGRTPHPRRRRRRTGRRDPRGRRPHARPGRGRRARRVRRPPRSSRRRRTSRSCCGTPPGAGWSARRATPPRAETSRSTGSTTPARSPSASPPAP